MHLETNSILKMTFSHGSSLETKLLQLECHFTWDLNKESADLSDLQTRLEDQIELGIEKKTAIVSTYCLLAYVRYLQGFTDDALTKQLKSEEITKERHGDDCERFLIVTYGNFAWLHYHCGDYSQCESYLEKLFGIRERCSAGFTTKLKAEVYGQKGWTYLTIGRKYCEKAKECFKNALELEPEESEWKIGYAIALYRTEDVTMTNAEKSLAIKQLRLAKETCPDNAEIIVLLGLRLFDFDKYDEAESLVQDALEMDPTNPRVIRYAGKYFRQSGSVDRAITLFKRAIDRTEKSAFLHHQLALCYRRKKTDLVRGGVKSQEDEVRQLIRQSIHHLELATTLKSDFLAAKIELAFLYGQDKDTENVKAEEMFKATFKEAEEKNEMLQNAHHYCGEFQQYYNNSEALAVQHYTMSLRLRHDSHFGKASAYALRKIACKRINRYASDAEAHAILGLVHKAKGENSEAIESYKKALALDPNNEEYMKALSELQPLSLQ